MRRATLLAAILAVAAAGLLLAGPSWADSLSVGVQTDSLSLGINIGSPPPVVVVTGTPVYHAPDLPHNYFVYRKHYYLYHEGVWLSAKHYNGPWTVIALEQVPPSILIVPAKYYKARPAHWKKSGPPPWAHEKRHGKKGHGEKDHWKKEHGKKEHGKKGGGHD
ncbi:MAG TPA: hypothetical protein VLT62_13695 [Candidatus Methylomirabilis sp.]|nr:hypothetical protein [Candidatus Methylomirabilis sp.]